MPTGVDVQPDFVDFTRPIGDVVTALIRAGLRLRELAEYPMPQMYLHGDTPMAHIRQAAAWLPASYLVLADRPG